MSFDLLVEKIKMQDMIYGPYIYIYMKWAGTCVLLHVLGADVVH